MNSAQPLGQLFRRLWQHLNTRRRLQLGGLTALMLASSAAEVFSIGAVLPFIGVMTAPERLLELRLARPILDFLALTDPRELLAPLMGLFACAALLSGALRLLLLWSQIRLSNAIGADFSIQVYERTLYQPYRVHVARHSSEIHAGMAKTNNLVHFMIYPTLSLVGSAAVLIAVLGALLAVDPGIASAAMIGFGGIYLVIIRLTKRRVARNSQLLAAQQGRVGKALQEGLGGIRDVLIDGSQQTYVALYRSAYRPVQLAGGNNHFINSSPRYLIEALGMILIAGLAYSMARSPKGIDSAIPVLGALALGAQRLLPILQNIYAAFIQIRGGQAGSQDALDLLDQPLPAAARQPRPPALPFRHSLAVRNLSFRYSPTTPWVLQDLSLEIPRGHRVGFIGATGSGKSTLIDVIMGLLHPETGGLVVDGTPVTPALTRAWQAHIAHVPQAIFLADVSIAENIAFGIPSGEIDPARVRAAARQARIAETIESWPEGYDTLVGERGVRLSGGQRQRIGIARALYKRADVLIFDEATSALDSETETAVMAAIEGLDREVTLLMIAHRTTTLRNCDLIVELADGRIRRQGSYADLLLERDPTPADAIGA
jgi:ATP-binding cassette subfamily B protein